MRSYTYHIHSTYNSVHIWSVCMFKPLNNVINLWGQLLFFFLRAYCFFALLFQLFFFFFLSQDINLENLLSMRNRCSCCSGHPPSKKEVKLFADISLMVWAWAFALEPAARSSTCTDNTLWVVTSLVTES